jgi:small subunit ribosomal protein S8e
MAVIQARSQRKASGGRYTSTLSKRKHMIGRLPTLTRLGGDKKKAVRTKGGGKKVRVLNTEVANLVDPKTRKAIKAKIKNVVENPANRYFVRRNVITKGTIVETEKGRARVTSRPGQDGTVNAVLRECR